LWRLSLPFFRRDRRAAFSDRRDERAWRRSPEVVESPSSPLPRLREPTRTGRVLFFPKRTSWHTAPFFPHSLDEGATGSFALAFVTRSGAPSLPPHHLPPFFFSFFPPARKERRPSPVPLFFSLARVICPGRAANPRVRRDFFFLFSFPRNFDKVSYDPPSFPLAILESNSGVEAEAFSLFPCCLRGGRKA